MRAPGDPARRGLSGGSLQRNGPRKRLREHVGPEAAARRPSRAVLAGGESERGLKRRERVRRARGRGGRELWASPECSSFTREHMVLVMESAATSRSLRRFLLVPEDSQSRRRCQGAGGRSLGLLGPAHRARRRRAPPPAPGHIGATRLPGSRSPPSSSPPGGWAPVSGLLLSHTQESWIPERTPLPAGLRRDFTLQQPRARSPSPPAREVLSRAPCPPLQHRGRLAPQTRAAILGPGCSQQAPIYSSTLPPLTCSKDFPGKAQLQELFHPIPPEEEAKPKGQVTSQNSGKRAQTPRRPGLHKHTKPVDLPLGDQPILCEGTST